MRFLSIFHIFFLLSATTFAQLTCVVVDDKKEPIPFVSILLNQKCIAQTDIDGKFSLGFIPLVQVELNCIGYQKRSISLNGTFQTIVLQTSNIEIRTIEVAAGINPADTIMQRVIGMRMDNRPEALTSFSYTSYNKFTASVVTPPDAKDSISRRLDSVFSNKDLFLAESVTKRKYLKPDLDNEVVIANKTSGIKNTGFSLLASQFQSFSFYQNLVEVLGKKYISPVHKNALNYYFFYLEDSFQDSLGSVYVISFKPLKSRSFSALTGVLYISAQQYALQNIRASTVDTSGIQVEIVQQFKKYDNAWFPVQLLTNLSFGKNISLNDSGTIIGEAKTYLDSILIGVEIPRREFSTISIENKVKNSDNIELLNRYRKETFSERNANTYKFIDSIGKEANLDQKLLLVQSLASGKIPLGFIAIDINKLYDINEYEGSRLGIGISNSYKLLKHWDIYGYWAYGIKDTQQKYGYGAYYNSLSKAQWKFGFEHKLDLQEQNIIQNPLLKQVGMEKYRNINRRFFNYGHFYQGLVQRRLGYSTLQVNYNIQELKGNDYSLSNQLKHYHLNFIGLNWRFSFREKVALEQGRIISISNPYPIFSLGVQQSISSKNQNRLRFMALQAKLDFPIKEILGKTFAWSVQYQMVSTADSNKVLYYAPISNKANLLGIQSAKAFESIPMHTYLSKQLVSVFTSYTLVNYLWQKKQSAPSILAHYNTAYASSLLTNDGVNNFNSEPSQWLQEVGLSIPAIFKMKAIFINQEFGIGAFSFINQWSNSASNTLKAIQWKLNYRLNF